MGRSILRAETAGAVRDISVTSTTIVDIHHRLGVNVRKVVPRTLLQELEGA